MPFSEDTKVFKHPSYGMAQFSRGQTTSARLFGSAVKVQDIITLTIRRGERQHDLNCDWYFGHEELIEVHMTEGQFAQLITHMNQGSGIPCTINHIAGKRVEAPEKDAPSEAELIHEEFKVKAKTLTKKLEESSQRVKDIANNSKLPQKDKKAIADAVDRFKNEAESGMPFLLHQLTEAGEKIVTQVKMEVVAFADRTLKAAGLSHLKDQAPMLIEDKKDKPND